jgi:hypothetical protein
VSLGYTFTDIKSKYNSERTTRKIKGTSQQANLEAQGWYANKFGLSLRGKKSYSTELDGKEVTLWSGAIDAAMRFPLVESVFVAPYLGFELSQFLVFEKIADLKTVETKKYNANTIIAGTRFFWSKARYLGKLGVEYGYILPPAGLEVEGAAEFSGTLSGHFRLTSHLAVGLVYSIQSRSIKALKKEKASNLDKASVKESMQYYGGTIAWLW